METVDIETNESSKEKMKTSNVNKKKDLDASSNGEDMEIDSQTDVIHDTDNVDVINVVNVNIREKKEKTWNPPKRTPSKAEEKIMMAEVLSLMTKVLMNYHLYTFGGELRVQEGNGSTGDRATGIIAQFVMVWWDRRFKLKLVELGVLFDMIK